jgi:hypothetical protein
VFCKMDVDDAFADPGSYRLRGCGCAANPTPVSVGSGCACGDCGGKCGLCPGFGFAQAPERRFHQILSRVRSVVRRSVRTAGRPPGFVRLSLAEIRVLARKRRAEATDHWIYDYVDLGPPVRIFDVIVVADRRKR